MMNKVLGGTLWGDVPSEYPDPLSHQQRTPRTKTSHAVLLEPGTILRKIVGEPQILVNSGHHQAVKIPAERMLVSAKSQDGLIEAMELRDYPFALGVQWHPEGLAHSEPSARALFRAFVEEAKGKGSLALEA